MRSNTNESRNQISLLQETEPQSTIISYTSKMCSVVTVCGSISKIQSIHDQTI